jgi:tetratricopeptide (TPR) repeat protein
VRFSVKSSDGSRSFSIGSCSLFLLRMRLLVSILLVLSVSLVHAQQTTLSPSTSSTLRGVVRSQEGTIVRHASVQIKRQGLSHDLYVTTNEAGVFQFRDVPQGKCTLVAENEGWTSHDRTVVVEANRNQNVVDLVLDIRKETKSATSLPQAIEFSDSPTFTVAGVSDWTAAGGHGSDSALRTSEELTRKTLILKPGDSPRYSEAVETVLRTALGHDPNSFEANRSLGAFYLGTGKDREAIPLLEKSFQIDPHDRANEYDLALAYSNVGELSKGQRHVAALLDNQSSPSQSSSTQEQSQLHRLAGELDEKLGDPLDAVREDELAVRLNPTEQNYFSWGTELLLHRAVWQAVEVFRAGAKAHPQSARILTGLGTALFGSSEYDEAANRLCEASDLDPANSEPYLFMGKVDSAAPNPSPCIGQRLARFAESQPDNAEANYLYAMALSKRNTMPEDPESLAKVEALLSKALRLDSQCADAELELGIIASTRGQYAKAISFYERALTLAPQLGEAHYRLGVALDRTGQPEKAKSEFMLHDVIEKKQTQDVERQREQIKQFLVVLLARPKDVKSQ